jgi:hypothetical protein
MTKFEYCNLSIAFQTNVIRIVFPDGGTKEITSENLMNSLNDLGKEEWELVSVTYFDLGGTFYFKRELRTTL